MKNILLFFILILFIGSFLPSVFAVQSYHTGISVILFSPETTEYDEGQDVTLVGQITQLGGSIGTGEQVSSVPYASYSIIDSSSGYVITTGQANYQGEFEYTWNATRYDYTTNVNLAAISDGVESNPITLQIYPVENFQHASPQFQNNRAIPEFGSMSILILAVGVIGIIFLARKNLIPRRNCN